MVHELPLPSAFNQSYLHLSIHFMLFRTMPDRNKNSTAFIPKSNMLGKLFETKSPDK